ncbi:hypothetical protein [Streptomyces sp. NPDC017230]|uniref:hypothetical protein n=1 Tax=unclassified Streptomyces TaxID=2593676 RepID=UPI0037AAEAB2
MTLISPNTVLANALTNVEDVLAPRIRASKPQRIALVVGTQINGAPHAGTSLVQSMAFATAARLHDRHGLPVEVRFSALDNAPHDLVTDPVSGHRYQRAYAQTLGTDGITSLVGALYRPLFDALSDRLAVPYGVETYSQQQATGLFRETWLRVLPRLDAARWWLAPSTGVPHLRARTPAGGRRSTRNAPAWNRPAAAAWPACRRSACTTAPTQPRSRPTATATSTSPPCTGTWSRS